MLILTYKYESVRYTMRRIVECVEITNARLLVALVEMRVMTLDAKSALWTVRSRAHGELDLALTRLLVRLN